MKSHVVHGTLACMAILLTTSSLAAEATKVLHFPADQFVGIIEVEKGSADTVLPHRSHAMSEQQPAFVRFER